MYALYVQRLRNGHSSVTPTTARSRSDAIREADSQDRDSGVVRSRKVGRRENISPACSADEHSSSDDHSTAASDAQSEDGANSYCTPPVAVRSSSSAID